MWVLSLNPHNFIFSQESKGFIPIRVFVCRHSKDHEITSLLVEAHTSIQWGPLELLLPRQFIKLNYDCHQHVCSRPYTIILIAHVNRTRRLVTKHIAWPPLHLKESQHKGYFEIGCLSTWITVNPWPTYSSDWFSNWTIVFDTNVVIYWEDWYIQKELYINKILYVLSINFHTLSFYHN